MVEFMTSTIREQAGPVQLGLRLTPHSTIALTNPPWIRALTQRIDYLLALPCNWDAEGGQSLDFECAMEVISFLLATAKHETPEPQLIPTSNRGVQLEWHQDGIDFEIMFAPESPTIFFHVDLDGIEREGEVAENEHLVASLIRGLPARNVQPQTTR